MATPDIQDVHEMTSDVILQAINDMRDWGGNKRQEAQNFVYGLTRLSMTPINKNIAEFLGLNIQDIQLTTVGDHLQTILHDSLLRLSQLTFPSPYSRQYTSRRMLANYLWCTVPQSDREFSQIDPTMFASSIVTMTNT